MKHPIVPLKTESPFLLALADLKPGEYADVAATDSKDGNRMAARIWKWRADGRLKHRYSRKKLGNNLYRIFCF